MRKMRDVSKPKLCRHSCSEVMSLNMTPAMVPAVLWSSWQQLFYISLGRTGKTAMM